MVCGCEESGIAVEDGGGSGGSKIFHDVQSRLFQDVPHALNESESGICESFQIVLLEEISIRQEQISWNWIRELVTVRKQIRVFIQLFQVANECFGDVAGRDCRGGDGRCI